MLDDGHQELMATLKAGNGIGPFGFRMTCSDEQITAELSMGEDSTPILLVTAKKQEASPETGTQEKTIFHYGEMSAEENSKLRGILYGKAIGVMYRMMKILPEEIIKVILPEI